MQHALYCPPPPQLPTCRSLAHNIRWAQQPSSGGDTRLEELSAALAAHPFVPVAAEGAAGAGTAAEGAAVDGRALGRFIGALNGKDHKHLMEGLASVKVRCHCWAMYKKQSVNHWVNP